MTVTQQISIDLQQPGNAPVIHAVQGEEYTREVKIDLYSGGVAWNPPNGCDISIRYGKPDGKDGIYDTLPDNTMAWKVDGNSVFIILAPQMLTVPGVVNAQVLISFGMKQLISTFHFSVDVEKDQSSGAIISEEYINWKAYYIPQTSGAIVGQYLQITKVDADGRVVEVMPVDAPKGGIDGDLDMQGRMIDNVGVLSLAGPGGDFIDGAWMNIDNVVESEDGERYPVINHYSNETDSPVILRNIASGVEEKDAVNMGQLIGRLPQPTGKVSVGQYLQVSAVNADGSLVLALIPAAPPADGVSPVVSVEAIDGGNRVTITDANGTKTVDVMDGADGSPAAVEITPSTTEEELAAMYAAGIRLVVINSSENLVPSAIAQNGAVFNGCGYRKEYRLTNTGGVEMLDDAVLTGFIPYVHGKIIEITGGLHQGDDYGNYMAFYTSEFEPISTLNVRKWVRDSGGTELSDENNIKAFTVKTANLPAIANAAYFRISLRPCVGRNMQVRYI